MWKKLFSKETVKNGEAPPAVQPALVRVPAGCALFHITHWKAASQWMRAILGDLFGSAVVQPEYHGLQFIRPVEPQSVYTCAYLGKPELDALESRAERRVCVLIRDLRDTLVSGYFSMRYSHEVKTPQMKMMRHMLERFSVEDGLLYVAETWLSRPAYIQRTWLNSGTRFYRVEDCMQQGASLLGRMFKESWKLELEPTLLEQVCAKYSFDRLSGGRKPGQEEMRSHYRRGVAGDWRNHLKSRVLEAVAARYNDLILLGGYETEEDWYKKSDAATLGK